MKAVYPPAQVAPYDSSSFGASPPATRWTKLATRAVSGPAVTCMVDDNLITGMDISNCDPPASLCEPCLEGKQTQDTISKVTLMRAEHVLSRTFTNVCGPLPAASYQGFRYFVTFVDNSFCYTSVSPLREKSEVSKLLKVFIARAKLKTGQYVKILCSDGGGEYMASHI